ncbi:MAG: hypothetical protein ABIT70_06645 [Sulfuriferula sp.]
MPAFALTNFSGITPRIAPRLLADNMAQTANNCKLLSGELRSWKNPLTVNTPSKAGNILSVFRMNNGTNDFWLSWTTDVNAVRGPIAGDTTQRVYYTGDGTPKKTNLSMATTGGGTAYPIANYEMGVPGPATAPIATLSGVGSGIVTSRAYVVTNVTAWGEESVPSPASNIVSWQSGMTVNLTGMLAAPIGNYNITLQRIYRTSTGNNGTLYLFVAERAISTATYNDAVAESALMEQLPSLDWNVPPSDLTGLIALPNGIMAGFSGNQVCFSEPYHPHTFPSKYRQTMDYPVVGLGAFGTTLIVCTTGTPYALSGSDPGNMSSQKLAVNEPCIAKRGIVQTALGVVYPSPNGLVVVNAYGANVETEAVMSRDEWLLYNPSSLSAEQYADTYFGFFKRTDGSVGGFILDSSGIGPSFVEINYNVAGVYTDPSSKNLYLISGNAIQQWDADITSYMPYEWRSRIFVLPQPGNYGACEVNADFSGVLADLSNQAAIDAQNAAIAAQTAANISYNQNLWSNDTTQGEFNACMFNQQQFNGSAMLGTPALIHSVANPRYVNFSLYVNGAQKFTKSLLDNIPFSLPAGYKGTEVEVVISANIPVHYVKLAGTKAGLAQV